jgi:phosphatidylserine/phosphatidylglycerophosphate/cardiolipin synthase-like enzyme
MHPPEDKLSELVLTMPSSISSEFAYETRTRITVSVLTLLIADAKEELVFVSPFIQRDEGINKPPLSYALESALARGVKIHIASTSSSLEQIGIKRAFERYSSQIFYYQPQEHVSDPTRLGSHAKFCLSDDRQAYVGSANLTAPGLNHNLELGLLVRDALAKQIYDVWKYLLDRGFFVSTQF